MEGHFRKVTTRQGSKSLSINIPVEYVEALGIKGGDTLHITKRDKEIIIKKFEIKD